MPEYRQVPLAGVHASPTVGLVAGQIKVAEQSHCRVAVLPAPAVPPGNPPPPGARTQLQLIPLYAQVDWTPLSVQALASAGADPGQAAGLFGTPVELPPVEPVPDRPPVEVLPPAPGVPSPPSSVEPPQAATNAKPATSKPLIPYRRAFMTSSSAGPRARRLRANHRFH
jgi:hypothetical protein